MRRKQSETKRNWRWPAIDLCTHAYRLYNYAKIGLSQLHRAQLDRVSLKLLDPQKGDDFHIQLKYLNKGSDNQLIMHTKL